MIDVKTKLIQPLDFRRGVNAGVFFSSSIDFLMASSRALKEVWCYLSIKACYLSKDFPIQFIPSVTI